MIRIMVSKGWCLDFQPDWRAALSLLQDKMLGEHERDGTFPEELYMPQQRPRNSLLVSRTQHSAIRTQRAGRKPPLNALCCQSQRGLCLPPCRTTVPLTAAPLLAIQITCAWSLLVWGLALRALVLAVLSGHVTALSVGVTCGVLAVLGGIMGVFLRYSQAEPSAVLPRRHQD